MPKRGSILLLTFILLFGAGILLMAGKPGSHTGVTAKEQADGIEPAAEIPGWLVEAVKSRFSPDAQALVKPEQITFMQVQMQPPSAGKRPELAAFLTLDRLNGVFLLFADRGGRYELVYEKLLPVYGVEVAGAAQQQLVLTAGQGGTGMQENKLFVIRHTNQGYREVWEGVGHSHAARETIETVDGQVVIDAEGNLIYLQLKRTLDSAGNPLMEQSSYQLYRFDEQTGRYERI